MEDGRAEGRGDGMLDGYSLCSPVGLKEGDELGTDVGDMLG